MAVAVEAGAAAAVASPEHSMPAHSAVSLEKSAVTSLSLAASLPSACCRTSRSCSCHAAAEGGVAAVVLPLLHDDRRAGDRSCLRVRTLALP